MKKHLLSIILALVAFVASGNAQVDYDPNTWCTGWHNPLNFTFSGGQGNTQWEGLIGSKPATASTCTAGVPWISSTTTVITAAQLASQSSSSSCTPPSSSVDISGQSDYQKRFVIKGRGTDAATGNRLTYTPTDAQGNLLQNFTSAVRLGNFCGNGEAEALRYQFEVQPGNALVTLYYAISLQNGQHNAAQNPEFALIVEKRNPMTNQWQRIGGDTLCFIKPSPEGSNGDITSTGFYRGSTGTQTGATYGENVYLPWNKVMISLYQYLYQTIRITIAAGDCSMTAHYAYCYIAGDCEPMQLTSNGCAAGASDDVTVLRAPKGMLSYQWYKSRTGVITDRVQAEDPANYTLIPGATDSIYNVDASAFLVNSGPIQTSLPQTTIMCRMESLMNQNAPSKTVKSCVSVNVGNTKPTVAIDTVNIGCDGEITLRDISYSQFKADQDLDEIDSTVTTWTFYEASAPVTGETPLATVTGKTANYTYAQPGAHRVKLRVNSYQVDGDGNRTCWNEKTFRIRSMERPEITMAYDSVLCAGDTILLTNTTEQTVDGQTYRAQGANNSKWHIFDHQNVDSTYFSFGQHTEFTFNETSTVTLSTYIPSQYFMKDTNADGIPEKIYCWNSKDFPVRVEQYPQLTVTGDIIVCEGQLSQVQVQADVPYVNRYKWCTRMDSTSCFQTGPTMQERPTTDKTYYVMVATNNNCIAWDSLTITMVHPRIEAPVTQICEGETIQLYGVKAASYTWEGNPHDASIVTSAIGDTIWVTPHETTTYTMVGHGSNGCSADPQTQTIQVYHYPQIAFEMSPYFIDSEEPTVTFRDVSLYGVRSLWDLGDGNTSTERQLKYTFTKLTEDSVYITLTSYNELNCSSDTGFYVPINLFAVWFPEAFTPTLSTNRTFKLYTKNTLEHFSIYIYDRRGALVFYSTDQNFEWNGKYKERYCDQGTYVYVSTYRRPGTTDIVTRRGTFLLLQ